MKQHSFEQAFKQSSKQSFKQAIGQSAVVVVLGLVTFSTAACGKDSDLFSPTAPTWHGSDTTTPTPAPTPSPTQTPVAKALKNRLV